MSIKKKEGEWLVDLRPNGSVGKRVRKKFKTKAEAIRFEAHVVTQTVAGKDWNPNEDDRRRLSELVTVWKNEHGKTFSNGEKYGRRFDDFCIALGNPIAKNITTKHISKWRAARLDEFKDSTSYVWR